MEHEEPEMGNERCEKNGDENNWLIQHQNSFKESPDDLTKNDTDKNRYSESSDDTASMELEEALGFLASRKLWHFLIFLAIATFDIPFAFNLMSPVFLVGVNTNSDDGVCHLCLGNDKVSIEPINSTHVLGDLYTFSKDHCTFTNGKVDPAEFDNVTWRQCTKFREVCHEPYGKTVVSEVSFFLINHCEGNHTFHKKKIGNLLNFLRTN